MNDHPSESRLSETLSAFLDGEASPEEIHGLLDMLERNPQLHATVDRHHRMRATLRGELHPGLGADFAKRVLAGIEAAGSTVTVLPGANRARPWMRGALGLAMAASLAAVVVLAARVMLPPPDQAPTFSRAAATALPTPRAESGVASGDRRDSRPWNDLSPEAADELSNYLISHNNSAMDHGLGGSMGFMRVAAHDGVAFGGAER